MFRLLGFDVHVRAGFVVMMALILMLYRDSFGVWLVGALSVLTLLHELGHALAARRFGCHAEISLEFLAGYAAYRPTRPLTRPESITISAAGPTSQIAISIVILLAMGVNPLSIDSASQSDAAFAIWWAGPALGVINLIPVLPLDGGRIAETGLGYLLGARATRVMAIISIALTIGVALAMYLTGRSGFVILFAFLLLGQFQILQATSRSGNTSQQRQIDVETTAWQTGRPGVLEPGQRLSPWFEAHRALLRGDHGSAMGVILADLRSPKQGRWLPPSAATPDQLRAVLATLPADLPVAGNEYSGRMLAEILLATGSVQQAGEYAARSFSEHRSSTLATLVARAAAMLQDRSNALRWLGAAAEAAVSESPSHRRLLAQMMDAAPEFRSLSDDPTFAAVRGQLV